MTAARVLVPYKITASMISSSTIAEPDASVGEVAWAASGSYVVDDLRTYNGSVWSCVKDHTGRTTNPELDQPNYWIRKGPTNRMSPFDDYRQTAAYAIETLTFVINPGFITGLSLWQMEGDAYSIVIKDAPGGTVIKEQEGDLYAQAAGFWELLFAPLPRLESVSLDGISITPTIEVAITISATPGNRVSIGMIKIGDWRIFIGSGQWGGTQWGASSSRQSYTFREFNEDGTVKRIVPRGSRRDVKASIEVPSEEAMYADAILAEVGDSAVVFEATDIGQYAYLNTVGVLSAEMTAQDFGTTIIDVNFKGYI